MVDIDELRITNDGQELIIKAHLDHTYFIEGGDNLVPKIEKVWIEVGDENFDPSRTSHLTEIPLGEREELDKVNLRLLTNDPKISGDPKKGIVFVHFYVTGTFKECLPCSDALSYQVRATMYMKPFYDQFMSYIKELGNTCQVPQGLIDTILKLKAINTAVDCGHYTEAIKWYNQFFNSNSNIVTSNCGCNG